MGQNKRHLSRVKIDPKPIFPNRMILECDETIHLHWRNYRLEMSDEDFESFVNMVLEAYSKYKMKNLHTQQGQHIELSKGEIKNPVESDRLAVDEQINLYKILKYPDADFYEDDEFVVIRNRELRIEMSKKEFCNLSDTLNEANEKLKRTVSEVK